MFLSIYYIEKTDAIICLTKRARRDSNPRLTVPETDALSPELRAHILIEQKSL